MRARYRLLAVAVIATAPTVLAAPASAHQPTVAHSAAPTPRAMHVSQPNTCSAMATRRAALVHQGVAYAACTSPAPVNSAAAQRLVRASATSNAATATPTVVPAPSWCGTDGNIYFYRYESCGVLSATWVLYNVNTGAIIGTINYNYITYQYEEGSLSDWAHQIQIQPTSWTGVGAQGGWTITGHARCSAACTSPSVNFPPQPAAIGKFANGTSFFFTTATAPGAVGFSVATWYWAFNKPGFVVLNEAEQSQVTVRCDNALPGVSAVGCVNPDYYPTIIYRRSGPYPELARHIGGAQASGLPGAYGSGTYLTRLTDSTLKTKNYNTACLRKYPRPTGKSCDEYPFESSHQGAYTGGGSPRTSTWCSITGVPTTTKGATGFSICMINASQNSGGGSVLGQFYNQNRVIENDRFAVWIQP